MRKSWQLQTTVFVSLAVNMDNGFHNPATC